MAGLGLYPRMYEWLSYGRLIGYCSPLIRGSRPRVRSQDGGKHPLQHAHPPASNQATASATVPSGDMKPYGKAGCRDPPVIWGTALTLSLHTGPRDGCTQPVAPKCHSTSCHHGSKSHRGLLCETGSSSGSLAWAALQDSLLRLALPDLSLSRLEEMHLYCSASLFPRTFIAAVLTGA